MSREWKPGDVAWLKGNGLDGPAIRTQAGSWAWVDPRGRNPVQGASFAHESWGGDARPLVVIDPEDREQVERLVDEIEQTGAHFGLTSTRPKLAVVAGVQSALREFANPTPPKPDEPTGLGAVVEDAEGARWVLVFEKGMWQRADDRDVWRLWPAVPAVRVLSEGLPS